jgi:serine-type D-Ala-D-Ala carboxypeptidase/endopeptidase
VSQLVMRWDDQLADRLAAENLFRDRSKDRRRAELAALRLKYGPCTPAPGFDVVENALRGQWTMRCERGNLQAAITLAPTTPPRVQSLEVRPAPATPPAAGACAPQED